MRDSAKNTFVTYYMVWDTLFLQARAAETNRHSSKSLPRAEHVTDIDRGFLNPDHDLRCR